MSEGLLLCQWQASGAKGASSRDTCTRFQTALWHHFGLARACALTGPNKTQEKVPSGRYTQLRERCLARGEQGRSTWTKQ